MGHATRRAAGNVRASVNVSYGSWELIWSHVHRVLVVNLGVAVADLPLLAALLRFHEPWRRPLLFGPLLLLLPGPALAAAFGYLGAAGPEGQAPAGVFVRAYRRQFRRAVVVSAPFLLVAIAAVGDVVALHDSPAGAALVPMAGVVALVASLAWVTALAHEARSGPAGARIFLIAPYAVVRHGLPALFNLLLLVAGLLLVNQAPLLGLAVLPGSVLFVVWRNCRVMTAFTDPVESRHAESRPEFGKSLDE
ncbi:hypothetical protein [Streptomyces beihaiensis]|uniref:DUF624 domain-containing protein n=1 Tax=Streptomyces beihaiensis TaxID=2984495 RepID=A0ABT3U2V8_9ACTN|nr:hypothetical protein [Streptomyces beihaiensis]MCX3062937.1 hypothetical protein [Streptomyces beihaiensis]